MTGLIVIDESGDLGSSGTKFFSMAAIIVLRPRYLKPATDMLPNDAEFKWYNTYPDKRKKLLGKMSELKFSVVYTVIDKNNPVGGRPIYGNGLYALILETVLDDAMRSLPCRDTTVVIDSCRFITMNALRKMAVSSAERCGINIMDVRKEHSNQNKCIQLADFVAGASRAAYEFSDNTIDLIGEKISVARRL